MAEMGIAPMKLNLFFRLKFIDANDERLIHCYDAVSFKSTFLYINQSAQTNLFGSCVCTIVTQLSSEYVWTLEHCMIYEAMRTSINIAIRFLLCTKFENVKL